MEINKTYIVNIQGNWNVERYSKETVERGIAAAGTIADLINDNLPEGLIAVCKEKEIE